MPCDYGLCHVGLERCRPGYIYIATAGDLCKIGSTRHSARSSNIKSRLRALRAKHKLAFGLVLVLSFDGCVRGLELALHKRFAEHRIGKDELFTKADMILRQIYEFRSYCNTEVVHLDPESA